MEKMDINSWCKFIATKEQTELSKKLDCISQFLSWGDFSEEFMHKSKSWLYDKLIGYTRGKAPIPVPPMTDEEMLIFKNSLLYLSEKIKQAVETL